MSKTVILRTGRPSTTRNKATTLASLTDEGGMKRVNFQLPVAMHTKLKVYAASHGKTITEVLVEYIEQLSEP